MLVKRRTLLALLAGVALSAPPSLLLARSGDGKGGHDAGDNDNGGDNDNDGGNDDGGNDDGGDNDGDDSGGSDDGGNDNGDADDSGSDDSGSDDGGRSKKRDDVEWSQDRVLKERELGRVIPLKTALRIVNARIHGRVIDVDLMVRSGKPQYRVKVRRTDGVIRTVRLDARTGKVIGILGF